MVTLSPYRKNVEVSDLEDIKKRQQRIMIRAQVIKEEEHREVRHVIAINILIVLIAVTIAQFLITFVLQVMIVDGYSMAPTLENEEKLILDKVGKVDRYDIVCVNVPGKDQTYVKRVVGLPGETVYISEKGELFINGKKLTDDTYGNNAMIEQGIYAYPVTLGKDEYMVLGDNRNHSEDSRFFGPIKKEDIIGKAFLAIYPEMKKI